MNDFGEKLKTLIKKNGLMQIDIADELNISKTQINNWCVGRVRPKYEELIKLAEYFNVSTDYLLGLEPPPIKKTTAPALNEDEQNLLDAYHNLTPGQKKGLFQMLEIEPEEKKQHKKELWTK